MASNKVEPSRLGSKSVMDILSDLAASRTMPLEPTSQLTKDARMIGQLKHPYAPPPQGPWFQNQGSGYPGQYPPVLRSLTPSQGSPAVHEALRNLGPRAFPTRGPGSPAVHEALAALKPKAFPSIGAHQEQWTDAQAKFYANQRARSIEGTDSYWSNKSRSILQAKGAKYKARGKLINNIFGSVRGGAKLGMAGLALGAVVGVATGDNYNRTATLRNSIFGAGAGLAVAGGVGLMTLPLTRNMAWGALGKMSLGALKNTAKVGLSGSKMALRIGSFMAKRPGLTGAALALVGGAAMFSPNGNSRMENMEEDPNLQPARPSWHNMQSSTQGLVFGLHAKRHR